MVTESLQQTVQTSDECFTNQKINLSDTQLDSISPASTIAYGTVPSEPEIVDNVATTQQTSVPISLHPDKGDTDPDNESQLEPLRVVTCETEETATQSGLTEPTGDRNILSSAPFMRSSPLRVETDSKSGEYYESSTAEGDGTRCYVSYEHILSCTLSVSLTCLSEETENILFTDDEDSTQVVSSEDADQPATKRKKPVTRPLRWPSSARIAAQEIIKHNRQNKPKKTGQ